MIAPVLINFKCQHNIIFNCMGIFTKVINWFKALFKTSEIGAKPVYFEEGGDKFGIVSDEIKGKGGNIEGYEILDENMGTKLYFTANQFIETERGLIFLPVWYVTAKELTRELELKERVTPDLGAMTEKKLDLILSKDSKLKGFVGEIVSLRDSVNKRLENFEKEMENIRTEMTAVTEKRLLGEGSRDEFASAVIEQKRRREIAEMGIKHCNEILLKINRSLLIPKKTIEAKIEEHIPAGIPPIEKPAELKEALEIEKGPKPTRMRVLKVEGRLAELETRAKTMDAEMRKQMGVIGREADDKIKKGLELDFKKEKMRSIDEEIKMLEGMPVSVKDKKLKEYIETRKKSLKEQSETIKKETEKIENEIAAVAEKKVEITGPKIEEIGLKPLETYIFDSFVAGPSNQLALASAKGVAENPGTKYNPLFIYSNVGLGKTHLMNAIVNYLAKEKNEMKSVYVTSEKFTTELVNAIEKGAIDDFRDKYRKIDVLLIDDVQFLANRERTQEEFFHTFNSLYNNGKQIVLSSDRPPKDIKGLEERLVSRFEGGLMVDIKPPDAETRMAILRKKIEAADVKIPDDVIIFIAENIKSNVRELNGALNKVVAHVTLTKTTPSVEEAKEILKDILPITPAKTPAKAPAKTPAPEAPEVVEVPGPKTSVTKAPAKAPMPKVPATKPKEEMLEKKPAESVSAKTPAPQVPASNAPVAAPKAPAKTPAPKTPTPKVPSPKPEEKPAEVPATKAPIPKAPAKAPSTKAPTPKAPAPKTPAKKPASETEEKESEEKK